MTAQSPEPQHLKSWQDAFQFPIPTVRRVEQELRRDIANNKEKLRALVGTRYRDLLGTAETIVSMNRDIQDVESNLTDVGRRSNPRLIEKSYSHLSQIKGDAFGRDTEKRSFGAQLAFLHRCTTCISKLLRKRGSLLVIAKLLVVSRLLHKTLSQRSVVPPFLESLHAQLIALRNSHVKRVEKRLASAKSTADDIVETLAAYCLVTSPSSDDAIRHFHHVRVGVIRNQSSSVDLSGRNVLKALGLYTQTLQTSRVLYSRRLSDVLGKLKIRPILTDPDIRNLDDLDVDVLGRWAAPDVSHFTPWIKLTDWTKPEAEKAIKKWSVDALQTFVQGCQKGLAKWDGFSELLSLRRKTLELWFSSGSLALAHSPLSVIEDIRGVFNEQLTRVLYAQAKNLEELAQAVSTITANWDTTQQKNVPSLWDSDLFAFDYSNGATAFKQEIMNRFLGWDDNIITVVRNYKTWLVSIESSRKSIDDLRTVKWIDILDDVETDDLDVDIPSMLSDDDPQILLEALQSAIRQAFDNLQSSFRETVQTLKPSTNQNNQNTTQVHFFLRLIRQIRAGLPTNFMPPDYTFSSDIVPELQNLLATEVITNAAPLSFSSELLISHHKAVPGRTLWEGDPELPVQPLPSTFKLLRRIMSSMEKCGSDLWDPSTVRRFKMVASRECSGVVVSTLENLESSSAPSKEHNEDTATNSKPDGEERQTTNGDENNGKGNGEGDHSTEHPKTATNNTNTPDETNTHLLRDRKIQLLFDAVYLASALAISRAGGDGETELVSAIEKVRSNVDPDMEIVKRVQKSASGYWKRTELLFGLLAVGGA